MNTMPRFVAAGGTRVKCSSAKVNFRDVGELCGYRVDLIIGTPLGDTQPSPRGVSGYVRDRLTKRWNDGVGTYAVVL